MSPRRATSSYSEPTWGDEGSSDKRPERGRTRRASNESGEGSTHTHRTAKVVEMVGTSRRGFEHAIQCALEDAAATTRGITGCEVESMSIKCDDGRILEYKVAMKIVFGIERTPPA